MQPMCCCLLEVLTVLTVLTRLEALATLETLEALAMLLMLGAQLVTLATLEARKKLLVVLVLEVRLRAPEALLAILGMAPLLCAGRRGPRGASCVSGGWPSRVPGDRRLWRRWVTLCRRLLSRHWLQGETQTVRR